MIRNTILTLILIVVNITRSIETCILALLIKLLKEIFENNQREQLKYLERSTIFNSIIYFSVDIICFVDYNQIFLKVLNALTTIKINIFICNLMLQLKLARCDNS